MLSAKTYLMCAVSRWEFQLRREWKHLAIWTSFPLGISFSFDGRTTTSRPSMNTQFSSSSSIIPLLWFERTGSALWLISSSASRVVCWRWWWQAESWDIFKHTLDTFLSHWVHLKVHLLLSRLSLAHSVFVAIHLQLNNFPPLLSQFFTAALLTALTQAVES